jgi:hypothetical protein
LQKRRYKLNALDIAIFVAVVCSVALLVFSESIIGFIGTDDDKNRIAYCYFYDFDLDTFGSVNRSEQEMITDFINDFFDWNDLP